MDDPPSYPDAGKAPRAPRWVKVSVAVAIALLVLFVVVHLTGHGFRHHAP